jgi:hypothetical protein
MANEFQFDVFLSHSAKDKAVVRDVAAWLKRDGVRVWLDEEQIKPGDSIPAKIEEPVQITQDQRGAAEYHQTVTLVPVIFL